MKNLKIIVGRANRQLGINICERLGIAPCETRLENFHDGEIRFQIKENIRGMDVFIVQPTFPPGDNILELLIMIDAAKRASARRVTAVIPYFGYARQDRKDEPRVPITSKLIANLITSAGADRVLTLDLHAAQIQGFFDIPTDQLVSDLLFKKHIEREILSGMAPNEKKNLVIVSPDIGGVKRVEQIAALLDIGIAIIYKRRKKGTLEAEAMKVIGDIEDKTIILVDDIVDTAGTIAEACKKLKLAGAKKVYIYATHALLSGNAMESLDCAKLAGLTVTDTIPLPVEKSRGYVHIIQTGSYFARAIHNIHFENSVSVLFNENYSLDLWEKEY